MLTHNANTPHQVLLALPLLVQAEPLVSRRAASDSSELHCRLIYPDPDAPGASHGSGRPCGSTFDAQRFLGALQTRVLGRVLLTAGATASTQVVVQENVAKLPDGLLFVADKQFVGKGRGGNVWESPDGCLMFSAVQQLDIPGQRLPFVQYIVSLAVVQAVQAVAAAALQAAGLGSSSSGSSIDVRIKWPNDVYAGQLKLGGILCHSSYRERKFYVIMGVGLNLANQQPTTCVDALIEQAAAAAAAAARGGQQQQGQQAQQRSIAPVSREDLLAEIMKRLEPMLERLAAEGFAPFEEDYCRHWLHSGQQVQLEEGGQRVPVTIRGLSSNGYLLATDAAGERYELHPDGNSLNFFNGLVRKKLPA
ncbi:hypothetical protein ABPG75_008749 [Micractinium tetrahymenae]